MSLYFWWWIGKIVNEYDQKAKVNEEQVQVFKDKLMSFSYYIKSIIDHTQLFWEPETKNEKKDIEHKKKVIDQILNIFSSKSKIQISQIIPVWYKYSTNIWSYNFTINTDLKKNINEISISDTQNKDKCIIKYTHQDIERIYIHKDGYTLHPMLDWNIAENYEKDLEIIEFFYNVLKSISK